MLFRSPQDWVKYSLNNVNKIPEDLESKLVSILTRKNQLKDLNSKYSSILTDVGINIVSTDDIDGKAIFSVDLPSVRDNIAVDPTNADVLYFCQEGTPADIVRLDMGGEPATWKTEYAELPKKYPQIKNLRLDPTGAFFLFYTNDDLVMITKDTLEEVKKMPGVSNVSFDSQGRIRGINAEGH